MRASVYYDAAIGHLTSWWEGEDLDRESNLTHIAHAISGLLVLRDAMLQDKFIDDRPIKSQVIPRADMEADTKRICADIINPVKPYTAKETE